MSNHHKVIFAVAGTVLAIIIGWIWKKRNPSRDDNTRGDGDLSSKPTPQCTPPPGQDYEVFLSFRGEDTRKEFTDHLYNRLNDSGVWVFRDNQGLHFGEEIGPELMKAIKASKIAIPIISHNYASSEWCLRELAQILECKKAGQIILPIFYKVTPSDVRNQIGQFKRAFRMHQKKHSSDDIQIWRNAFKEVGSLKGLESKKIADGHEGELVKIVLGKVFKMLKKVNLVVPGHLVGMENHVEKIMEKVDAKPSNGVQAVLIHGMGGIGKTTLAKLIYNTVSARYEHYSFLPNVRERSKLDLQRQLISNVLGHGWLQDVTSTDAGINIIKERFKGKKVLILLDDVNHRGQLNDLAGESGWFGPKSIILVTSRNSDMLAKWENVLPYELNELDHQQSFQLFCLHAFGRDAARQCELEPIAKRIVFKTGGLPLAIEVIGSLLFAKPKDSWIDTLKILEKTPNDEVMGKLRISYDSLSYAEQQIFLDIACFSFEKQMDFSYYMWDACGFYPRERVKNLITLSLIKIGNKGQLIMHDQLRDLGQEIVRQEGFIDVGRRSRILNTEEAWDVLKEKQGTKEVQALRLQYDAGKADLTSEHFKDLINLRFLQMDYVNLAGDFQDLFPSLRWLQSAGLNIPTNFHPRKLVVLDLSYSSISEHWIGWSQMELVQRLKVLQLCSCKNMTTTPDFSAFKALEILKLKECSNLESIHPSICNVKETLITLDISGCTFLSELPTEFGRMEKLTKLIVDDTAVREIPIFEGSMTKLEILSAQRCFHLLKIPDSIGSLVNLRSLLGSYSGLRKIPESIGKLESLVELDLSCTGIMELPESIGDLENLKQLNISTPIERLTPAIGKLKELQIFSARYLSRLIVKEVPDISELSNLQCLDLRGSSVSCLPESTHKLSSLQKLELLDCRELTSLPDLPCSLTFLSFQGDSMETLPNISDLRNLNELIYKDTFLRTNRALKLGCLNKLEKLTIYGTYLEPIKSTNLFIELPSSLVKLCIINCCALQMLPDLSNLKHLSFLELHSCSELVEIDGLEGLESLENMVIICCRKLSKLSSVSPSLVDLSIYYCHDLEILADLSRATGLKRLEIESCSSLAEIKGLDSLKMLRDLQLKCVELSDVEGIDQLTSLETLEFYECPRLERIGDLSCMKTLKRLELCYCKMLRVAEGIDKLSSLRTLKIVGCDPGFKLPDTSKLRGLNLILNDNESDSDRSYC